MAWVYLPSICFREVGACRLQQDGQGYEPVAMLSSTSEPKQLSLTESATDTLTMLQSGMMLTPLMAARGAGRWISSLEDSLANLTPLQAKDSQNQTKEISGLKLLESSSDREHGDSLEKTSLELFETDLYLDSWQTLKEKASRQRLSESLLAPLVDHTHGPECSLWPTPRASEKYSWNKTKKTDVQMSLSRGLLKESYCPDPKLSYLAQWMSIGPIPVAEFAEWMMGWPKDWTALSSAEMEWTRMRESMLLENSEK